MSNLTYWANAIGGTDVLSVLRGRGRMGESDSGFEFFGSPESPIPFSSATFKTPLVQSEGGGGLRPLFFASRNFFPAPECLCLSQGYPGKPWGHLNLLTAHACRKQRHSHSGFSRANRRGHPSVMSRDRTKAIKRWARLEWLNFPAYVYSVDFFPSGKLCNIPPSSMAFPLPLFT